MEGLEAVYTTADELLSAEDQRLFKEGAHLSLHRKLGAHLVENHGATGVRFAVWAPNAAAVSVIGEFNGWDASAHPLALGKTSGVWSGFIPGASQSALYKYHIVSRRGSSATDKADPFGFMQESPPGTASVIWDLRYQWGDHDWMNERGARFRLDTPVSIYEVHLGSWMKAPGEAQQPLNYRELAGRLAEHVQQLGFTHVELLPIMEHPFYGSWGYQTTGYFAPTSRHGTPRDFMFFVDYLHQRGIGVILDWVPSHFPGDAHGLAAFDGTPLFEHSDPREGKHPDWNSLIFDYGRREVRSFLLSSASFWLDEYHIDALRLDAVASMLYLDYSRKPGEWTPNKFGGRENLEAIDFLRQFNASIYQQYPQTQTIAEESTAWPMVSRPAYMGGLGFGFKWDMGFMHDTLSYVRHDPVFRKFQHNQLTFRGMYAFTENFVMPLSHDEVARGKGSLLAQMPGDDWRKFANLRLLLGYMFAQPGKKLLFMGGEFGSWSEWDHDAGLDWSLLEHPAHAGLLNWVRDLNRVYRAEPSLHECDCAQSGFEWVDCCDSEQSTISWVRRGTSTRDLFLAVANFTPVVRRNYRLGVPESGRWRELLNSDATHFGGSGQGNFGGVDSAPFKSHGRSHSVLITLPPLAIVGFKWEGGL